MRMAFKDPLSRHNPRGERCGRSARRSVMSAWPGRFSKKGLKFRARLFRVFFELGSEVLSRASRLSLHKWRDLLWVKAFPSQMAAARPESHNDRPKPEP